MMNVARAVCCVFLLFVALPSRAQEESESACDSKKDCTDCTVHDSQCSWAPPVTVPAACQQFQTPCGLKEHPGKDTEQFAVIGDFGFNAQGASCEPQVGEFLKKLDEQYGFKFILTVGDNNYWSGEASTLNKNLAPFQWALQVPLNPVTQRFFPTLGNHDWATQSGAPYLKRFSYLKKLPGKGGRYYERADPAGIVDLFALNANPGEPDGITQNSKQAKWLQQSLGKSNAVWKLVYFHQPALSTAQHDTPEPQMSWPFSDWGASAVLMGHEHAYERILHEGIPYFIDGLGGHPWVYQIHESEGCKPVKGSEARFNGAFGALIGVADRESITFCFYSVAGSCVDTQTLMSPKPPKKERKLP